MGRKDSDRKKLTHWGRVMHICVSKLSILGSENGLLPGRRQAIILTNAGILLIWPLGTNFSEILIEINTFSLKKCIWKCRLENGGHLSQPQCVKESNLEEPRLLRMYSYFVYHILNFVLQKMTKFTMEQPYMLHILCSQYHACWCPGA